MDTKTDLMRAFAWVESRGNNCRPANKHERQAITLIEVLIVIGIIGVLVAFLLPSVRTSREAARRNQCICNLKQLTLAIQNHHDTRGWFPMASTSPLVPENGIQKYGAVGVASPAAEAPENWTAGQQGDGYSWIVQIMPQFEEGVIYDKLTQSVGTDRLGRLRDAAFASKRSSATQNPGTDWNATTNPYIFSSKPEVLRCPSYPGEEDVTATGFLEGPTPLTGWKVGASNYVAIPSTHIRQNDGDLESGLPTSAAANTGKGCALNAGAYCGNGGIPFPGTTGGRVTKTGHGFQSLSDGSSKTVLITETREEKFTSWYSGFASYVVGAWPQGTEGPLGVLVPGSTPAVFYWGCGTKALCDTALNKGDTKGVIEKYYIGKVGKPNPHRTGTDGYRVWGPSSRHPDVVQHGYGDAHAETVAVSIDRDVYIHLITRNGREVDTTPQ